MPFRQICSMCLSVFEVVIQKRNYFSLLLCDVNISVIIVLRVHFFFYCVTYTFLLLLCYVYFSVVNVLRTHFWKCSSNAKFDVFKKVLFKFPVLWKIMSYQLVLMYQSMYHHIPEDWGFVSKRPCLLLCSIHGLWIFRYVTPLTWTHK